MRKWTDEKVEAEIRAISDAVGHFPSNAELSRAGRNDIANQLARRGGFLHWSDRIGVARQSSDSDTGWDGEIAVQELMTSRGYSCVRSSGVKAPFDLMVNEVLRIDVKSARHASYQSGNRHICAGWFYRTGKIVQSDLLLLYQLDTGIFYGLPWWIGTTSNITITATGGKYAEYQNNWPLIDKMIETRSAERGQLLASA